jgi:hypothetical protein
MKLTASFRTISPKAAQMGPWFSKKVEPFLAIDRNTLSVANELASVIHVNPDKYIAQHCAVIIRQGYEESSEDKNDRLIVCAALTESGHAGANGHLPLVIRIFGLDKQAKRLKWLET